MTALTLIRSFSHDLAQPPTDLDSRRANRIIFAILIVPEGENCSS